MEKSVRSANYGKLIEMQCNHSLPVTGKADINLEVLMELLEFTILNLLFCNCDNSRMKFLVRNKSINL